LIDWKEDNLDSSSDRREQRRNPRISISLPVEFRMVDGPSVDPGIVINASETGLLIQSFKDMHIGSRITIKVLSPKGRECEEIMMAAEIIWKDTYFWEDWEGYQYGLKFCQVSNEDCPKLTLLLNRRSDPEEISYSDNPDEAVLSVKAT
jgi:hypothetical protein